MSGPDVKVDAKHSSDAKDRKAPESASASAPASKIGGVVPVNPLVEEYHAFARGKTVGGGGYKLNPRAKPLVSQFSASSSNGSGSGSGAASASASAPATAAAPGPEHFLEIYLRHWGMAFAPKTQVPVSAPQGLRLAENGKNFDAVYGFYVSANTKTAIEAAAVTARAAKGMNEASLMELILGNIDFDEHQCTPTTASHAFKHVVMAQLNAFQSERSNSYSGRNKGLINSKSALIAMTEHISTSCGCSQCKKPLFSSTPAA